MTEGVTSHLFSTGVFWVERVFDKGNSATLFSTAVFHFVAFLLRTGVTKFIIRTSESEVFVEGPPLKVECCAYITCRRHVWNVSLVYYKGLSDPLSIVFYQDMHTFNNH